jgi:FAD/FMN-containing dehydrogenase
VQAQSVEDVQNTVRFARERNLRLVIRNTGHDLGGRSSGPEALQLDVSGLKNITREERFEIRGSPKDPGFLGIPAVTVGGGVQMKEVYQLCALEGFTVVGGGSSSVGIAGGFMQTGGMSIFSPSHGLASDNVLEIELVVANVSETDRHHPSLPQNVH